MNLADVVDESAREWPAAVAIIDGDRKMTYAGLDDRISSFAAGLLGCGVKPGDRVALMLGNRLEFVVAFYATLRAGAVSVPMNPLAPVAETRRQLEQVGARLLISDHEAAAQLAQSDETPCAVIAIGSRRWDSIENSPLAEGPADPLDPESPAVLLFTSGTEGMPQPAVLSHRALLANLQALQELPEPGRMEPGDVTLAVLPLFHVYSLTTVLSLGLAAGATVVLCERFSAPDSLSLIQRHRVSVLAAAPPMYVAWSAEPELRQALASVRLLMSGAAPLPADLFDQFATINGRPIWEGYGLTECSPVVATALVAGKPVPGSVGKPLPNVDVQIVAEGAEPGLTSEEPGQPGQIWVRGPSLFSGYWPDGIGGPNEEGWFQTGDIGYLDDDGYLFVLARRTDLILVSGFNVYPREVEQVLSEMPGLADCAVIGVDHPLTGQAVKALLVIEPGQSVPTEAVLTWCEKRLARYKCPTIVEVVAELPRLTGGKLARNKLA